MFYVFLFWRSLAAKIVALFAAHREIRLKPMQGKGFTESTFYSFFGCDALP